MEIVKTHEETLFGSKIYAVTSNGMYNNGYELYRGSFLDCVKFVKDRKALKQADKIISAIHEAAEIHAGRKKGQTFNNFLKRL